MEEFIKNNPVNKIHTNKKIEKDDYNQITAQGLVFFQIDLIQMTNYTKHN